MKTKVCTKCKKEKPLSEFHSHKEGRYGKQPACKECHKIVSHKWYEKNKDKASKNYRLWAKNNPEKLKKSQRRSNWKRLGIDCDDKLYNYLFNKQQGCCAICGIHQSKLKRALDVDHNHISGKTRGLLCWECNLGNGNFRTDIKGAELLLKAAKYLKMYE